LVSFPLVKLSSRSPSSRKFSKPNFGDGGFKSGGTKLTITFFGLVSLLVEYASSVSGERRWFETPRSAMALQMTSPWLWVASQVGTTAPADGR
jgi:hypothetical protein